VLNLNSVLIRYKITLFRWIHYMEALSYPGRHVCVVDAARESFTQQY